MILVFNEVSKWINIPLEFQQFLFGSRLKNIFHIVISGISLSLQDWFYICIQLLYMHNNLQ